MANVLARYGVNVALRESEINNVYDLFLPANTDEEVLRLDVSMDKLLAVQILHSFDALKSQHRHCLLCELAVAEAKEGL
jgi:hypothetical protein